jgi:hypothetical protein
LYTRMRKVSLKGQCSTSKIELMNILMIIFQVEKRNVN